MTVTTTATATDDGDSRHWSLLSDDELLKRYKMSITEQPSTATNPNQFRPASRADQTTSQRICKMLRDRLEHFDALQQESKRLHAERALARKKESDRVKANLEVAKRAADRKAGLLKTEPIGLTKYPPEQHDKFYSTLASPVNSTGKYGLDRPVYGESRADGRDYRLFDYVGTTSSLLREPANEGTKGHYFVGPLSTSPGQERYSRNDLMIGCSVSFVKNPNDPEAFRIVRRDAFGETPPPGAYFTAPSKLETFSRPRTTNSYLQATSKTPGAVGLPLFGISKTERVIIGPSHQASMFRHARDGEIPPIGQYFQKPRRAPCREQHAIAGSPAHSHKCAQQKDAHAADDFFLRKTATYLRHSDPARSAVPGSRNQPVPLKEPRGLLPTPEEEARRLTTRAKAIAEGEVATQQKKEERIRRGPSPDPALLAPNLQMREKEYQTELSERLKIQTEQRFKFTPKEPYARPSSPLPRTAFFVVDQEKALEAAASAPLAAKASPSKKSKTT